MPSPVPGDLVFNQQLCAFTKALLNLANAHAPGKPGWDCVLNHRVCEECDFADPGPLYPALCNAMEPRTARTPAKSEAKAFGFGQSRARLWRLDRAAVRAGVSFVTCRQAFCASFQSPPPIKGHDLYPGQPAVSFVRHDGLECARPSRPLGTRAPGIALADSACSKPTGIVTNLEYRDAVQIDPQAFAVRDAVRSWSPGVNSRVGRGPTGWHIRLLQSRQLPSRERGRAFQPIGRAGGTFVNERVDGSGASASALERTVSGGVPLIWCEMRRTASAIWRLPLQPD